MKRSKTRSGRPRFILLLLLVSLSMVWLAMAVPEGPTLTYVTNYTKVTAGATGPYNNTKGYIHEYAVSITQINNRWKAFVGNVTATLTLTDNTYSIYAWAMASNSTNGVIFTTRNNSINWNYLNCSNASIISAEEYAINITSTQSDSLVNTFTKTNHTALTVNNKPLSSCPTLYTYVNNSAQSNDYSSNHWQEVMLASNYSLYSYHTIYATKLELDYSSFSTGRTYDFQLIVPDYGTTTITDNIPYYFYVELA